MKITKMIFDRVKKMFFLSILFNQSTIFCEILKNIFLDYNNWIVKTYFTITYYKLILF